MRLLVPLVAALVLVAAAGANAKGTVPSILFPVVGPVKYYDDFGEPRGGIRHQGNDLVGTKRTPVVAVEPGKVEYWTTSRTAGCMLYLHGVSGTDYQYIHLNNDLTTRNDNRGSCVQGVAYAVPNGATVDVGQAIGYLGDSGDANGIHPHLHFEIHPGGGAAVDPFPYLKKARHPLVAAPPAGTGFSLRLTGTVVGLTTAGLTITVGQLTSWPSHLKLTNLNRRLTLAVPDPTAADAAPGERVIAWTMLAPMTIQTLTGADGALSLDRLQTAPTA
jgi:hypothetical protein